VRHDLHVIYIGFYRAIHQNFIINFWIMFLKSLNEWINQSITQYKVLNLLQVPYTPKDKFQFQKACLWVLLFCSEAKPHYEAKLPQGSWACDASSIASRMLSRRVGGAVLNLLRSSV
jgi:hypothetical protein